VFAPDPVDLVKQLPVELQRRIVRLWLSAHTREVQQGVASTLRDVHLVVIKKLRRLELNYRRQWPLPTLAAARELVGGWEMRRRTSRFERRERVTADAAPAPQARTLRWTEGRAWGEQDSSYVVAFATRVPHVALSVCLDTSQWPPYTLHHLRVVVHLRMLPDREVRLQFWRPLGRSLRERVDVVLCDRTLPSHYHHTNDALSVTREAAMARLHPEELWACKTAMRELEPRIAPHHVAWRQCIPTG
jgi:hypothetical protein